MATDTMTTNELIQERFDASEQYAENAIEKAREYMDSLETILSSLEVPDTGELEDTEFPPITPIDYSTLPSFTAMLEDFPTFVGTIPDSPSLDDIPDIDVTFPTESLSFIENTYSAPSLDIGSPPEDTTSLSTVEIPAKPDFEIPEVPTLTDIEMPEEPTIDLPDFDAVSPTVDDVSEPAELNYTEGPYNSDIRVDLFAKILDDLRNGGTGLDVDVEADLYDRGLERQRVENERLYKEVEDQFSATGFGLPSGTYASRLLEVSSEISRKNDQLNREITINQAELAQKNTQFTVEQARQIEGMLMEFFNQQENRSLEAAKATAQNAVDIFNSLVSKQKLKLEQYQAEAAVFEQRIRAEMAAVEIYKAKVESTRAKAEVQQARVNAYKAQVDGLEAMMGLYATEMESAKIQAEVQLSQIEVFKAQTEAYVAQTSAEKAKVDIYSAQLEGERTRAQVFSEKVNAYQSRVDAKKSEADVKRIEADNVLKTNQLKIDEYRAQLEGYRAELETELKNAQLQVEGFKTEASAYEVQTNAKGMEYQTRIQEISAEIERVKGQIQKQVAEIEAAQGGYVALKELQAKGTEGMMNANAQLAASAMTAVNASASQGHTYGHTWSESESMSESHIYNHDA